MIVQFLIYNAPYHSRMLESVPTCTMSLRKQRASNPKPKFAVDEMAKAVWHEVVRLPLYHCGKLNPIELAWSQVKDYN